MDQDQGPSLCPSSDSEFSAWYTFTTLGDTILPDTCDTPTGIVVDSVNATMAWLSWDETEAEVYQVKLTPVGGTEGDVIETSTEDASIMFDDLLPNGSYEFVVKAQCDMDNLSAYSEPIVVMTEELDVDPCPMPEGEIISIGEEEVVVSWTSSSTDALYLLEVEHLGLTYGYHLITTTSDTTYIIEGLMPGGDYQWKIMAYCADDTYSECSDWMNFSTEAADQDNGCPAPTNLDHEDLEGGSVLLSWSGDEDHFDYEIEVQSLDTTPYYSQINITTDTTIQIDGLAAGGIYQFKVNALCHSSELSEDSDWYEFGVDESALATRESMILAYPNPVRDQMTVEMPEDHLHGRTLIELTDLAGRIIHSEWRQGVRAGDQVDFGMHTVREGIYKLTVRSEVESYNQLIFVRRD